MFTEFTFFIPSDHREIFIALMDGLPFDAFEETNEGYVSAIEKHLVDTQLLAHIGQLQQRIPFDFVMRDFENRNWNAIWEASFKEMLMDDFCQIRAPFHPIAQDVEHQIIIEPRMAFGTGHHETTRLMIRAMREMGLKNKDVCDFGSGTGILAILAKKMGARYVVAVERDAEAFENLKDNVQLNQTAEVVTLWNDHLEEMTTNAFDVFLVNITRNVILQLMPEISRVLSTNGDLVMSGFLIENKWEMMKIAGDHDLQLTGQYRENDWLSLHFRCDR